MTEIWLIFLTFVKYMPLYINGNKIEKDFFEYLDYAENNLKEKVINLKYVSYPTTILCAYE